MEALFEQWRYAAIFLMVILGNMGLPVPEETVLALGGYLASRGVTRLHWVVVIGVISAVIGDNIGYWLGRRYGALAVFVARFVPGLRFLAGPLAGAMGMPPITFTLANALGALAYVPYAVGLGYAVGYSVGDVIQGLMGRVERFAIAAIAVLTLVFSARRILRTRATATREMAPPS